MLFNKYKINFKMKKIDEKGFSFSSFPENIINV